MTSLIFLPAAAFFLGFGVWNIRYPQWTQNQLLRAQGHADTPFKRLYLKVATIGIPPENNFWVKKNLQAGYVSVFVALLLLFLAFLWY